MPRFAFGMITLNAAEFVAQSIASVYDFAERIVIADGATPAGRAAATPAGGSKDGTIDIVRALPDPERKIVVLPPRLYADKNEQSNAYMAALDDDPPDYVWQLDADELYRPHDLAVVAEMMRDRRALHASFRAWHFWHDFEHVGFGSWWTGHPFHRVNKFWRGARYREHRPPTIERDGVPLWHAGPVLTPDELEREGVYLYHYSHVTERQVLGKMEWYARDGTWSADWARDVWLKWRTHPHEVEARGTHPVNLRDPGDAMGLGTVRVFKGEHPPAIMSHPRYAVAKRTGALRVCHVMHELSGGGGVMSPLRMASRIAAETGGAHHVVTLAPGAPLALPTGLVHLQRDDQSARAIADEITRGEYDVVHVHWWERLARMRAVLHGLDSAGGARRVLSSYSHPASARYTLGVLERSWADAIVFSGVDTLTAYDDVTPVIARDRESVIVASDDLAPYVDAAPVARGGGMRFGRASALHPFKVPADLIEQVAPLFHALPDAEFHVFGEGPLRTRFERDIRMHGLEGRVVLRGFVATLPAEMKALDVYLYHLPRRSYASSELNLQGAMAAGLPIVVVPSEGTGWMFPHGTAEVARDGAGAVRAAQALAQDPERRRALGARAREHALASWGLARMAAAYVDGPYLHASMRFPVAGARPPPMEPSPWRAWLRTARARARASVRR